MAIIPPPAAQFRYPRPTSHWLLDDLTQEEEWSGEEGIRAKENIQRAIGTLALLKE